MTASPGRESASSPGGSSRGACPPVAAAIRACRDPRLVPAALHAIGDGPLTRISAADGVVPMLAEWQVAAKLDQPMSPWSGLELGEYDHAEWIVTTRSAHGHAALGDHFAPTSDLAFEFP